MYKWIGVAIGVVVGTYGILTRDWMAILIGGIAIVGSLIIGNN